MSEPQWLAWAKQIQAIAQTRLAYGKDVYDIERYEMLRELAVEILEQHTGASREAIRLSFAAESGYATPKVDVRAVIIEEDRILLVRERLDGAWALPGGWADIGLSPFQTAVKEVREETGYEAQAERLLAVFDKQFQEHPPSPHHIYKFFIGCRITGGVAAKGTLETSEARFFSLDMLPELSVERNTARQIRTVAALYLDPAAPVLCD